MNHLRRFANHQSTVRALTLAFGVFASAHAFAEPTALTPEPTDAPPVLHSAPAAAALRPAAPPAARADLDFTRDDAERAEFSGWRYAAELVVSGVGGGLASYGTYTAICGDEPCFGGWAAGNGVMLVATPVLTMGTGAMLGGRGNFGTTMLVGLLGFTATAPFVSMSPTAAMGISLALMPILCPLGYELSSNNRATEMKTALHVSNLMPGFTPLRLNNRTIGAVATLQGNF
jgi:hypothetical protein